MAKVTRKFIAVGSENNPDGIAGVIVNDHEQQHDADYEDDFSVDDEIATRYKVTVTVEELGPL